MPTTIPEEQIGPVEAIDVSIALWRETRGFTVPELRAVLFVARRLAKGRVKYGTLNPDDGRNWYKELSEELADALVYASAEEQRTAPQGDGQRRLAVSEDKIGYRGLVTRAPYDAGSEECI